MVEAARAHVEQTGELPKTPQELVDKKLLATSKVPAGLVTFTVEAGVLAIALEAAGSRISGQVDPKKVERRAAGDPRTHTIRMIGAASKAFLHLKKGPPKSVEEMLATPGILLEAAALKGLDLKLTDGRLEVGLAPKAPAPLTDADRRRIDGLIRQVGAEQSEDRDQALRELFDMIPGVLEPVRAARKKTAYPEVAARLEAIEEELARRDEAAKRPQVVNFYLHQRKRDADLVGLGSALQASNERNASSSLKSVATAQEKFQLNHLDRNGVADYWTGDVGGLYCLQVRATLNAIAALNDVGVASADADLHTGGFRNKTVAYEKDLLLTFGPKAGFLYQAVDKDETGGEFGVDTDGSGYKVHNRKRWAATAYPHTYVTTGTHTFIVNENAKVFRRDTGGLPVLRWPGEFELRTEWKKVE